MRLQGTGKAGIPRTKNQSHPARSRSIRHQLDSEADPFYRPGPSTVASFGRLLTKYVLAFAAVMTLPMTSFLAQELPKVDDSFEVEPPLLVPPRELETGADQPGEERHERHADVAKLQQQLERAKKSAASSQLLVKMGVLAKVEAEQRAIRAVRLEAELAKAQMAAAKEEVTLQKARLETGEASKADLDASVASLARASAVAQAANTNYQKAQLDLAVLDLRRQRQLLALGSARKSDVARAEEKLAELRRGEQRP